LHGAEDQPGAPGDHRARGELGHAGDDQRARQQHGDRGQQGPQRAVEQVGFGGAEDDAADPEGGDDREQRLQQRRPPGQLDQRSDEDRAQQRGGDVGRGGLQDQRDAGGDGQQPGGRRPARHARRLGADGA
jgi:hypothetical protein